MDEDMSFPNPVVRTDLPVKKSRWPKVVAGLLIITTLGVAFLPQILHTRIGRRFLRARLESKYAADVTIDDFRTSWFGGTSARGFWIKGGDGRVVGCQNFQSDKLSLFKLLRGKYQLGHCTIDGLVVDYLLDDGESGHADTYERLTGAVPRAPGMPPAILARLSGEITLRNGQLSLSRGEVDPGTLLPTARSVKFTGLSGTFVIPSLDSPWTFKIEGDSDLQVTGTLCLGAGGLLVPASVSTDVVGSVAEVPTDLAAVFLPQLSVADCHTAMGDTFDSVHVSLKGSEGIVKLHAQATAAHGKFDLSPTFDLKTQPASISCDSHESNTITFAMPAGYMAAQLAIADPLLVDATAGTFTLRIDELDAPFARWWSAGSGKGVLEAGNLKWKLRQGKLMRQIASIAGMQASSNEWHLANETLRFEQGSLTVAPLQLTCGDTAITLSGNASTNAKLHYSLVIGSPRLAAVGATNPINVPLNGTPTDPKLDIETASQAMPTEVATKFRQWVASETDLLRRREMDAMQQEKDRQVQEEYIKPMTSGVDK